MHACSYTARTLAIVTAVENSPAQTLSAFSCDSFQNSGQVAFVVRMVDPAQRNQSKGVYSIVCPLPSQLHENSSLSLYGSLHGHRYTPVFTGDKNTVPL
jgi:hypothetical protein